MLKDPTTHVFFVSRPKQINPSVGKQNKNKVYTPPVSDAWTTSTPANHHKPAVDKTSEIQDNKSRQQYSASSLQSVKIHDTTQASYNNTQYLKDIKKTHSNMDSSGVSWWKICLVILAIFATLVAMGALSIGIYLLIRPSETSKNASTTNTSLGLRWKTEGSVVAGLGAPYGSAPDRLYSPLSLAVGASDDELYIADYGNNRVQRWIIGEPTATTVAGQANGLGGATAIYVNRPTGLIVNSNGTIYVSDSIYHRVQCWLNGSSSGTTVAGAGVAGSSLAHLSTPRGLALDSTTGTIYIADSGNHRIMSYASGATVGTVAVGGNGPGSLTTQLYIPAAVYFDSTSNSLYIANEATSTIVRWVLGASGWTLVAGHPYGYSGSTNMMLNSPYGLTLDPMSNVYVADTVNHRIQLFLAGQKNGTTIAGTTGTVGSTNWLIYDPYAVALDSRLNMYVADTANHRVLKFERY